MSHKLLVVLTVASLSLVMFFAGCGPETKEPAKIEVETIAKAEPASAQIALKMKAGDSSTYKFAFETVQDYKFEQPSLDKKKVEQNVTRVETTFLQEVQAVNADSSATVKVTIKDISVFMKDRDGVKYDFDSSREADKGKAFNRLVGKSYTIQVTSDGKVTVVDAADIRKVTMKSIEGRVAKNFLSDDDIIKRHEVISLPNATLSTVEEGKGWSKVVSSHPKLLEQKSFEKSYVFEGVDGDVATVTMTAFESDKPAEGPAAQGGFGIMSKMFDTQEKYTGEMKLDLASGKVIDMNEKFVATYIASDTSAKVADKGPDTLTMGLTHSVSIKKID